MMTTETPPRKTMRRWFEMRLANEAAMILHGANGRKLLHRLAKKTQDGTLGKTDPSVDQQLGSEDMQIRIGDEVHNHYQQEPPQVASQPTPASGIKRAAMIAALVAGGGGIGAAVPMVLDAMKPATPPAAVTPTDENTQYELHIGGGQ